MQLINTNYIVVWWDTDCCQITWLIHDRNDKDDKPYANVDSDHGLYMYNNVEPLLRFENLKM